VPSGNYWSPNYAFDLAGGLGYFWTGTAWVYGYQVSTLQNLYSTYYSV